MEDIRRDDDLQYGIDPRQTIIDALARRDGYVCAYCESEFDPVVDSKRSCTIDHHHSIDWCRKKGWPAEDIHGMANLKLACKGCNSAKSNREWLDDGTLAPRGRVRAVKKPRPTLCDTCMSGRILLVGETCDDCGSGPQPMTAPKAYQLSPKDCNHEGEYYCWQCFVGYVPRKTALTFGGMT